ncbi:DUF6314 family protein [Aeromicrobium alkaliterrae]|uniref:DUF6314 domain-containing protein n=1 Tax=Aeromicrobium alkaliterrae TaxID=302168 RepID=A0ABN2JVM6_9ACTN
MDADDPRDLVGTWQLTRRVDDRLGPVRHVTGTSELSLIDDGRVRWSESGTMTWDGGSTPFTRTLFVELREDGWWVTFDDGRDFHPWDTDSPVVHPCGADLYEGRIEPKGPDAWSVVWNVTGPAKDYTMTSHLTR